MLVIVIYVQTATTNIWKYMFSNLYSTSQREKSIKNFWCFLHVFWKIRIIFEWILRNFKVTGWRSSVAYICENYFSFPVPFDLYLVRVSRDKRYKATTNCCPVVFCVAEFSKSFLKILSAQQLLPKCISLLLVNCKGSLQLKFVWSLLVYEHCKKSIPLKNNFCTKVLQKTVM